MRQKLLELTLVSDLQTPREKYEHNLVINC